MRSANVKVPPRQCRRSVGAEQTAVTCVLASRAKRREASRVMAQMQTPALRAAPDRRNC